MPDTTSTIQSLKDRVQQFAAERNWEQYHTPKNLAMSILIEAAELAEHFQWQRTEEEVKNSLQLKEERKKIADELADVFSYLLSMANVLDIDLSQAFEDKLAKTKNKYPADQWSATDDKNIINDYLLSRNNEPNN